MLQERDTSTNMKGSATMQENAGLTILGINSVHGMVIKPPCAPTQSRRRIRHSVSSVAGNTADLNDLIVNGSSRRYFNNIITVKALFFRSLISSSLSQNFR